MLSNELSNVKLKHGTQKWVPKVLAGAPVPILPSTYLIEKHHDAVAGELGLKELAGTDRRAAGSAAAVDVGRSTRDEEWKERCAMRRLADEWISWSLLFMLTVVFRFPRRARPSQLCSRRMKPDCAPERERERERDFAPVSCLQPPLSASLLNAGKSKVHVLMQAEG